MATHPAKRVRRSRGRTRQKKKKKKIPNKQKNLRVVRLPQGIWSSGSAACLAKPKPLLLGWVPGARSPRVLAPFSLSEARWAADLPACSRLSFPQVAPGSVPSLLQCLRPIWFLWVLLVTPRCAARQAPGTYTELPRPKTLRPTVDSSTLGYRSDFLKGRAWVSLGNQ